MAELTVEMTYGSALHQAALESGKEKLLLEEAQELVSVMKANPELQSLLNNPTLSPQKKKEMVRNVFEGRISVELLNLLCILVDKRRTRHYADIVKTFKKLVDVAEGVSYGKIYSAQPLNPEQLKDFESETGKLLRSNVSLENEIDPSLIGGVKIFVDGKVLDASLRTRLQDLGNTIGTKGGLRTV